MKNNAQLIKILNFLKEILEQLEINKTSESIPYNYNSIT